MSGKLTIALVALLMLLPSPAYAFDLTDLFSLFSSSDEQSQQNSSKQKKGREVLSNSDILGSMNPLDDRDLDIGILDNTGNTSRSMYLDREIEIYKEQNGIEDGMFDKADRYISKIAIGFQPLLTIRCSFLSK